MIRQRDERVATLYPLAPPRTGTIPHDVLPLLPANWPAEVPLARITTCGASVSIAVLHEIHPSLDPDGPPDLVYGPPDAALLAEKSTSTAFLLLSVLASQPHCSATRDWLSETLGRSPASHEDDLEEGHYLKRVDNVVSRLRHLLFPPVLRDLPTASTLRRRLVLSSRGTRESGRGIGWQACRCCGWIEKRSPSRSSTPAPWSSLVTMAARSGEPPMI